MMIEVAEEKIAVNEIRIYAPYCHHHATCGVPGCFATPDRLSNKTLPWYCNARQRRQNSPLCEAHGEDARDEAPSYPPEEPPSNVHQCVGDCTEHRHSNKVFQPDSFCRLPGCNRLRQTKEGGESEWCENHTCGSYLCLRKRSDRQPSMTTCERHSCGVERCDQAAQGRSNFCRRHGCEADNCGQYKEAQSWYCNQHECQRARCLNKAVPGTDHCPRHLEESRKREEEKKVAEEREKEKKEKKKKESEGYRREPRHCYQTAVVTPLVIVDEDGVRSEYAREPSPVCRRGGLRYPYPDCLDDAHTGRVHRGYYDRVGNNRCSRRSCWDD
ncbi:hypothetical protein BBAD15_g1316 [Beauveria bassiana D1-5]|uniref:Uncharacterized protein n=1 Tax=Beauveria bassiana D1-5 TaxID=1245745 RepID=A0A0A2VYE0_BEABA|nr:hypothetical protein BBAD15_g1316 [Beauveria bassiana D1-5]